MEVEQIDESKTQREKEKLKCIEEMFRRIEERELKKREKKERRKEKEFEAQKLAEAKEMARVSGGNAIQLQQNYFGINSNDPLNIMLKIELVNDNNANQFGRMQIQSAETNQNQVTVYKGDVQIQQSREVQIESSKEEEEKVQTQD